MNVWAQNTRAGTLWVSTDSIPGDLYLSVDDRGSGQTRFVSLWPDGRVMMPTIDNDTVRRYTERIA